MQEVKEEEVVVVSIKNVSYNYGHSSSSFFALDNISFNVNASDIIGIIGPNGAGKSTLFRCMLGLIDDYRGDITIFDVNIKKSKKPLQKIGYIPQQRLIDQSFPATVQEIVSLGIDGRNMHRSKEELISTIRFVDLEDLKDRRIGELSGGQQQRVLIAKALINDAKLLILDEPTAALDARAEYEVFIRFSKLVEGRMAVIISHRFSTVRMADRIVVLNEGKVVEEGTHDELLARKGLYSELFLLQAEGYR